MDRTYANPNLFLVPKNFLGNIFLPQVLNYGGIGFSIGHELTHAFDDHGRRFLCLCYNKA